MTYKLAFTARVRRDAKKLARSGLRDKAARLLDVVRENPYQNPPQYEKLVGNLQGCYSRRINIQHRIVYDVLEDKNIVRVLAMWTHYE
ncbi:MAG: Txe/YoeB family addiction module toxin [Candidatus Nanopelagicales bacterium]|nr:Txe/YoeB family addiction module toxin [Candidatus Nanopelagicales bacterium]